MKAPKIILVLFITLLMIGTFFYFQDAPVEQVAADETGMTRQETEDMMRQIGYVQ